MSFDYRKLQIASLTARETDALKSYKAAADDDEGNSHCFCLNEKLRSGLRPDEMGEPLAATIQSLDSVFDRCPVSPEPLTLYRGSGSRSFLQRAEPGYKFRIPQYWSASWVRECAFPFMNSGGALLELSIPSDFPMYNLETLAGAGGTEHEILLPRGMLWELLECRKMDNDELPPEYRNPKCPHDNIGFIRLLASVNSSIYRVY